MIKLATQAFDKITDFIDNNKDTMTALALGGGIGTLSGLLAPSGKDKRNSTARERFVSKAKNALLGAALGAASGALVQRATKNFGEAKLTSQVSPEKKIENSLGGLTGSLSSPFGTSALATVGAGIGANHLRKSNAEAKLDTRNYILKSLASDNSKNKSVRDIFNRDGAEKSNKFAKKTLERYLANESIESSEKLKQLNKAINGSSNIDISNKKQMKNLLSKLNFLGIDINDVAALHMNGSKAETAEAIDAIKNNNRWFKRIPERALGKLVRNWRLGAGAAAGAGIAAGLGSYLPEKLYNWYYDVPETE